MSPDTVKEKLNFCGELGLDVGKLVQAPRTLCLKTVTFLLSIQDKSVVLTEDTKEIEDLLLFIEVKKLEIQKRDKDFFDYYD